MHNVRTSFWNYRLTPSDVKNMNLAVQNYSGSGIITSSSSSSSSLLSLLLDSLFIHPPVFVYTLALFQWLELPLPLFSVLCHVIVLLLLPSMTKSIVSLWTPDTNSNTNSIIRCASIIFSVCPIAAFCSQKIWLSSSSSLLLLSSSSLLLGSIT